MYYSDAGNQRETYKLVEKLSSGEYKDELAFLRTLVRDIISQPEFEITGGRIWELVPSEKIYILRSQFGKMKKIPKDYAINIADQPFFSELVHKRVSLHNETVDYLRQKGIMTYSLTGVGDIIRVGQHNYFKYLVSFNANEILQSFFENLNIISSIASIKIREITSQAAQKKLARDIDKASEIQRNLLPQHYIEFHDYKIFGACIPDNAVGGDYFDYLRNKNEEEERLAILVSDAASKGLPAAIQALFVSGAIRMGQFFSPKISALLSRLNTLIYETFPYERFVTLFYCELTMSSNRLVLYANAGHCSPIHYRSDKNDTFMLPPTGGLLGIMEKQSYNVENIALKPNDILVIYSDGITEAHDKHNNLYGEERLKDMIIKYKHESPKNLVYLIIEDVQKFSAESVYSDDKTIVVIKRDPETEII